jgi:hypothetical protein
MGADRAEGRRAMIRLDIERSVRVLLCVRFVRPWRHTGRWGWTIYVGNEFAEWFPSLGAAIHALQAEVRP